MALQKDENANKDEATTFPFPPCWQDNERMENLLAPFRLRTVNPENYDSKMKFWQDLIAAYCQHKKEAYFSKSELQAAFARGSRVPNGLDTVFEDMTRKKIIRRRSEYEYDPENTWSGWAVQSFLKKPVSWGLTQLKSTIRLIDGSEQGLVEYVHLPTIQKFCQNLLKNVLEAHQGKLVHYKTITTATAESIGLTEDCLLLCLHTLNCQHKIGLAYTEAFKASQIHFIKVPCVGDSNVVITDTDRSLHNLQLTQSNLLAQLDSLEEEIKSCETKARQYVAENKRQMAKVYLRKKHLLEKTHEKRFEATCTIEQLLNSINEAMSNGEIIETFKVGSKALQMVLNKSGLKYDAVDDVMLDVREALDTHREIQDAISNTDDTTNENEDLEQELNAIMKEMEEQPERVKSSTAEQNMGSLLAQLNTLQVNNPSPTKSDEVQETL